MPHESWSFEVEGIPKPKERGRQGQSGKGGAGRHFFTPTETNVYEMKIAGAAMEARVRWSGKPFLVEVLVFVPDRQIRDGDNILKAVLDGLQKAGAAAFPGDDLFRVQEKRVRLGGIDRARPRVEIRVSEMDPVVPVEAPAPPPKAPRTKKGKAVPA